jgi:hypothetical protein
MLHLAASLADQAPVSLGDAVTGIDDRNVALLVAVIMSFRVSAGCDLRHRVADTAVNEMPMA